MIDQAEGLEWWGYRHMNGTIHLKRYFGRRDIEEARESPFVAVVSLPFFARTRQEAEAILKGRAL